jgi:nitrite reductase/ring-hydroxylating ferredoxin subunit
MMQRQPVCAIEDLPPGSMKLVQAGKFGVGVYNIDGALYAIANYCSHEGAPLCAGYVVGTNEFAPGIPGQPRS